MDKAKDDGVVWQETRRRGVIARLNKGYGFITGDDGVDYFFHWSHLNRFSRQFRFLEQGEEVEFRVGAHPVEGPRAGDVKTGNCFPTPAPKASASPN